MTAKNDKGSSLDQLASQAWDLLKSMKFAIILLLVIAAASIFNLFANEFIVSASTDPAQAQLIYERAYGDVRANLLMFLQMYSPYTSWWYSVLLGLLMLSLIVCVIDRAGLVYRQVFKPRIPTSRGDVEQMTLTREIKGKELRDHFPRFLKKKGFKLRSRMEGDNLHVVGYKQSIAHSGGWLVHIGFVLLVIGGAMIARSSQITARGGLPGDHLAPNERGWGFNVRIDSFWVEYHPLAENQWVQVDGGRIIGRTVEENRDGSFDVQAYRPTNRMMRNVDPQRIENRVDMRMQGGRLDQMNISDYHATLTVIDDGKEVVTETIEVNKPLRYEGYRFYQSSFNDQVTNEHGTWTTIINVRKDRGAPFVWAGIIVVTIGLLMGLYLVPQRIVAVVDDNSLVAAGHTGRNRTLFSERFNQLLDKFEKNQTA